MKAAAIRIARRVAWVLLALVVVVANLVAAAFFYLRTDGARERVLALARSQLRALIPGGVSLGRSEGNLTEGLILHDLVLRDREQVPAVTVERLELHYTLLSALVAVVQIDSLEATGVTIVSRQLADGRDNLATMSAPTPPPPDLLPFSVALERIEVDLRVARLPAGGDLADVPHDQDARGHLHARVYLGKRFDLDVPELLLQLRAPTPVTLHAHGNVRHLNKDVSLRGIRVHVDADPGGLHHKTNVELRGPIVLDASGDGTLDDLSAALRLDVASPSVKLTARTKLHKDRVELRTFTVKSPFADVQVEGTYRFDKTGEGNVKARVSDLSALQAFGAPPLTGRIKLDGHVARDANDLRLTLQGQADDLVAPGAQIKKLRIDVATAELGGHAKVDANGVVAGGLRLRSVALAAEGSDKEVRATISAAGAEGVELDVALSGVPRIVERRFTGFEATLQRLRVRAGGSPWEAEHPAHVSADFDMRMFALSRMRLLNDPQQITLEGRLMGQTIEGVFVDVKHFDLSQLPGLLSPGHVLPKTDLSAEIEAHGPLDDPEVGGTFTGEAHGKGDSDLIHASGNGDARLAHGRLAGKVFVTIGGQKASGKFDVPMPLKPGQPISVGFDASVLLSPTFAEFLVPKLIQSQPLVMYALGAKVTAQGQLTGTTSEPELHASARVARWVAGDAHGDLGISLEYKGKRLGTSATLELSSLPAGGGTGGGVVALTSELPMDLSAVLTGGQGRLMNGNEPMHAELKVKHVGLDHLPFQAFNVVPPVQHGWVDGEAELAGNRSDPRITASFDAVGLTVGPMSDVDAHGSFRMKGGAATIDTRMSTHGSEAFRVHGSLDAGHDARSLETHWMKAPLAASLEINDFDLGRLGIVKGLAGSLRGRCELTGTLLAPHAKAEFGATDLRVGQLHHRAFRLSGTTSDGAVNAKLLAELDSGQSLAVTARIPWTDQPLSAQLTARGFSLDFGSENLPVVRLLRGLFDGDVQLSGTMSAPKLAGDLRWSRGELHLASTAMTYRDFDATMHFAGERVDVPSMHLLSGTNGQLQASGFLVLDHLVPASVDAKIATRQILIQRGGVGMLLDADITVTGKRNAQGILAGNIRVEHGTAKLPDHPRDGTLLPTASLEDVTVVKPPTAKVSDKQPPQPVGPRGPDFSAQIEGPFEIRGPEVSATTRGSLTVDLSGAKPDIHGNLTADPKGWVRMFGRRYDVERGAIRFDGAPEPILDFRISHRLPKARIGVEVKGPASKPELHFWSEPPIYDQAQVAGVMLGNSPTVNGVSTTGLSAQSDGVISKMVVGSIRKNFLSTLPIDVYRFDGNSSRAANASGSQIELGKYLTESLYVGYAYRIGTEGVGVRRSNSNEARLDYRFSQRGQLEAKGGDAGVGGLDLFWTFRP